MKVEVISLGNGSYSFCAKNIDTDYLQSIAFREKSGKLRGSVMMAGPLLARYGGTYIPKPGGDKIGRRRLDTHILGFQQLGATADYERNDSYFRLQAKKLKGSAIILDEPSVTGTANIVMAAVLAQGATTLYNAACEPYLQQLCLMLNRMGANIKGIGSNFLTIEGVDHLGGTTHRLLPDMIEVGSFIGLAAMTQSDILIQGAGVEQWA
jgi:UDP-N-acetylglucosamine 1-carboxyvinyltransferase